MRSCISLAGAEGMSDFEDFDGMTVSERLFSLGLLLKYSKATRDRDILKVRELLARVGVEEGAIAKTIEMLTDDDS